MQERNGHLEEDIDILPEARPFNGDPPPRTAHRYDLEPLPPLRVSSEWTLICKILKIPKDVEDENVWKTENWRVLEVPCVVYS